jgi:hypothetical protein
MSENLGGDDHAGRVERILRDTCATLTPVASVHWSRAEGKRERARRGARACAERLSLRGEALMLTNTRTALCAALVATCVAGAFASDWPNYQGPKRDGTSTQKGVSRSWPTEGPKVLWTVPLGVGFGGPAVKDGRVYLLDRDEAVGDTLRVYDIATGKELWHFAYAAPGRFMFNGSRTVPTLDGDLVYTIGPLGEGREVGLQEVAPRTVTGAIGTMA